MRGLQLYTQRDLDSAVRAVAAAGKQVESAEIVGLGTRIIINVKPRPHRGPCIYVLAVGSSSSAPVKIGFTNGLISARIKDLQTGSPYALRCIFSAPADRQDEHRIHLKFGKDRVQGEWFRRSGRLTKFLEVIGRGESIAEALARA